MTSSVFTYFTRSLPIGAFSVAVIIFVLHIPRQSDHNGKSIGERLQELDLIGASIFIPAIICLLLALQWGGSKYDWSNSRIIGLFVGFAALISIFTYWQFRLGDKATIPPRILTQRTVAASSGYAVMFAAGFFLLLFYLPIYFQSIKGVSATKSGIDVVPLLLSTVLSSIVAGGLISTVGYYSPFLIASSVIFSIGTGLLSTYKVDTAFGRWFGYQILTGAGVGAGFQVPLIAVQTVLPLEDIPVGTAVVIFFQTLGGALFISIGQNVFQNGVIRGTREFVPQLDPKILIDTGATEIRSALENAGKLDLLPQALQAYMVGLTDALRVAVATACFTFVASLFMEWRSVKDDEAKRKKEAAAELGLAV
jgi:hypothetical protein